MDQGSLFAPEQLRVAPNPQALQVLREAVPSCKACKLCASRSKVVFGVGNGSAPPVAFVGEGPGEQEDLKGEPFVGRAGKLLDQMIGAMGLARDRVYICNVVNCRPPENRKPEPDEISACSRYLVGQLRAVQPQVIVALGATAAQTLLRVKKGINDLRGKWHVWENIPLRATFHPAYLLRVPGEKNAAWLDLKQVMSKLGDSEHVFAKAGG
jgi:DNA polymerase